MAKSIKISSGGLFIGSPIYVDVVAESPGQYAYSHKLILQVSAALNGVDATYTDFLISSPAEDGETINFDISSALRSVADKYDYTPQTAQRTYPFVSYQLTAWDEWMIDGVPYEKQGSVNYGAKMTGLMGTFSDMERLIAGQNGQNTLSITSFSTKPDTPEVMGNGETLLSPSAPASPLTIAGGVTAGPIVKVQSLASKSGKVSVLGRSLYVVEQTDDRYSFQILNSRGVLESASACTLKQTETNLSVENFVSKMQASFGHIRRSISRKSEPRMSMSMTSGPLSRDWEDWWRHEFCMTRLAWIKLRGVWIPCTIEPDETIKGPDQTASDIASVEFTVKLDVYGSIR